MMGMIKKGIRDISEKERVWMIILLCSSGVMLTGLISDLYLGDEIYHYRFAKDIFAAGKRVTFDPLYGMNYTASTYYLISPLWHILLATLWKTVGGISLPLAQIYHTIYYALLLFFTYHLGKEIYGEEEGKYSLILVSTIPMVISFGILFYVDVPLAAFSTLTFLLILRGRYLLAGFGFGLMYFTKFSGLFFGISFLLVILFLNYKKKLLTKLLSFSLATLMIIIPDIYWREKHSHVETDLGSIQQIMKSKLRLRMEKSEEGGQKHEQKESISEARASGKQEYDQEESMPVSKVRLFYNSSLLSIKDNIKYFGLPILFLLIFYLIRRRFQRKDCLLWTPVFFFFLCVLYICRNNIDIRYLLPITPFLCVIVSPIISSWKTKKLIVIFLAVCSIQFLSVLIFVYSQRNISPDVKEGIDYIKRNIPEDAIIVYPEYNLTEYTNRKIVWTSMFWDLRKILWADDEFIKDSLIKNKVHYILIKKTRIYDDKEIRHIGGYPASFVSRLPTFRFIELIYNNKVFSLWKLREGDL